MTHDAETETAAAVIEDLLYQIPAHWRRSDKPRRHKRLGWGARGGTTIGTTLSALTLTGVPQHSKEGMARAGAVLSMPAVERVMAARRSTAPSNMC
jgi:hypothetical protein